ncbi:MAG: hypothetical protein R3B72_03345 [Polyangiaceae bacterium]
MRRLIVPILGVLACGAPPAADVPPQDPSDATESVSPRPGGATPPSIQSEVGALDPEAVEAAFSAAKPALQRCLDDANAKLDLPVIGGEMEVEVQVAPGGEVLAAFPKRSTFGHLDAERCVVDALRAASWPSPEGGEKGIARTVYRLDPPGRAAAELDAGDLGAAKAQILARLARCRADAGVEALAVTLYVDADGKLLAAGADTSDASGENALACAASAAKGVKLPSPGSFPGKVRLEAR